VVVAPAPVCVRRVAPGGLARYAAPEVVAVRWKPVALVLVVLLGASCTGCIPCPPCSSCTVKSLFVSPSVDGVIEARLISILDAATRTVDLALYSFTDDQLGAAVIRAHQRGVMVRVILDDGQEGSAGGREHAKLVAAGIAVVVEKVTGLMHHKFLVVDRTITVTGSYNWSDAADQSNFENVVVIVYAEVADAFTAEFNRLWNALKAGLSP